MTVNLLSLQCSKQVTWCFTPSQPVQLYSGKDYSATLKVFLKAVSGYKQELVAHGIECQNTFFFPPAHDLLVSWKMMQRHSPPPILLHLSPVILAGESSVVRVLDSWSKGRWFESLQEQHENFLLQGQLSVLTLISVSVPPLCYRSSM